MASNIKLSEYSTRNLSDRVLHFLDNVAEIHERRVFEERIPYYGDEDVELLQANPEVKEISQFTVEVVRGTLMHIMDNNLIISLNVYGAISIQWTEHEIYLTIESTEYWYNVIGDIKLSIEQWEDTESINSCVGQVLKRILPLFPQK